MRICIAGVPKAGKTTLADHSANDGVLIRHTDDLIESHGWSEASAEVVKWFAEPGGWIIEGVSVPRALRKWIAANKDGNPADVILYLKAARIELTPGQQTMAKGCDTVWGEIEAELRRRGALVLVV